MRSLIHQPHSVLWLAVPVLLGLSLLGLQRTMDLQLHDTYFVLTLPSVGLVLISWVGLLGLGYWLMRRYPLISWLTGIHVVLTLLACVALLLVGLFFAGLISSGSFAAVNKVAGILLLIVVGSQFLYLANLLQGLVRGRPAA